MVKLKIHTYYRIEQFFWTLQVSQVNSIVCITTRILYMKHLSQNIKLFSTTVLYIFVQVNMMITSYFYMKLTERFRWMTDTCHLCSLQHWKLYHVWKKYDHCDDDSKHIVKLLCLPTSLNKHVLDKFEYQVQLQFHICIGPTINYKFPNEFWEKNTKISLKSCKIKIKVYHSNLHDHICTLAKTHIVLNATTFS